MRKAADKDEAYREGMESRAGTKVFTDGSDVDRGVGAAAILFRDGQRRGTLKFYLGASSSHTVYEAELVGIILAAHLLKAERGGQEAEIGVDSQAAMDALNLNKPTPSHYLVDEARKMLKAVKVQHPTTKLLVRWIPGHMGIEGNELADSEAKKAASGDGSPPHTLPAFLPNPLPVSSSATKRAFSETIKHDAAELLAKSKRYPRLRTIDASVPSARFRKLTAELTRKQASLLIRRSPITDMSSMPRERGDSASLPHNVHGLCPPTARTIRQIIQRRILDIAPASPPESHGTTLPLHIRDWATENYL